MVFIVDIGKQDLIDSLKKLGDVFILKTKENIDQMYIERKDNENVTTVYFKSLKSNDDISSIFEYFKNKKVKVDYIFSFSELKFQFWLDVSKVLKCKTNVKDVYIENSVKSKARNKVNNYFKDVMIWDFNNKNSIVNFPVMVKPKQGFASQHIYKVNSMLELDETIKNLDSDLYYIEEYIEGEELSIECLHFNNKHLIFGSTKKLKFEDSFVEKGHISDGILLEQKHIEKILKVFDILDYNNSISHSEWMLINNDIKLIESHPRLGGDLIPDLYINKFEENMYDIIVKVLLGKCDDNIKINNLDLINFSFSPTSKFFPCKYNLTEEIELELKENYGINLILNKTKNNSIIENMPSDSFTRQLLLKGTVPKGVECEDFLLKIESYIQKELFTKL